MFFLYLLISVVLVAGTIWFVLRGMPAIIKYWQIQKFKEFHKASGQVLSHITFQSRNEVVVLVKGDYITINRAFIVVPFGDPLPEIGSDIQFYMQWGKDSLLFFGAICYEDNQYPMG
jgi:hypothetical protein